ncbi:hypothetical protein C1752_14784 [Acaryochloris thomasi RCC1774]|uniref:Tetratricopeptide repeat protein n=1 Tax=Acaryochloris thomasi RCC1774 TaxID=1764569 RepID=A0A2W1J6U4_9CYAN|nr:hypothetical protein [Acaryochloris thomasi]PZD70279.1 hypothetical protein C1752_14784 [Acaryochloris thomasi RCC1774]
MLKRISSVLAILPLMFAAPVVAGESDRLPRTMQTFLGAQQLVSEQRFDEALPLYWETFETTRDPMLKRLAATGVLHLHLTAGFYHKRSPEKVIPHLDEALKLKPDLSNAWHDKGIAHCELKQYSACDQSLTMAIKHSRPEHEYLIVWKRAMHRADMGKRNLAAQDFALAIKQAVAQGETKAAQAFALSARAEGININLP